MTARLQVDRRRLLALGAGALTAGCATGRDPAPGPRLEPLRLDPARLVGIDVCLRPFRPGGPRLETEGIGGKRIVHNYGHGGSGWSLSWGCAEAAAARAMAGNPGAVAVIGAGIVGLTTALRIAEAGAAVTVYARDFPAETRSARATGVWSPASRIALADAAPPGFVDRWEGWARTSYAVHQRYAQAPGAPAEMLTEYAVSAAATTDGALARTPPVRDYLRPGRRLADLTPAWRRLGPSENPFAPASTRAGPTLVFNVATYLDALRGQLAAGGVTLTRRTFPDMKSLLALAEPVVVNCAGYGARTLAGDATLTPVRGQVARFAPQPEARYALYRAHALAVSRRDALIVQNLGPNDDYGYGLADETPDPDETVAAAARLAAAFRRPAA